jgi:hypothetical protein
VVDIYDYVEQIRVFLHRRDEHESQQSYPVQADLVMKFRAATGSPVEQAQWFLSQFSPERQGGYVEAAERYHGQELHDPVEDNPEIRLLFAAICEEAQQEIEVWQRQQQEDRAAHSSVASAQFDGRRGLGHRYWARVKVLMRERHGIDWKTPAEMNPWSVFD